MKITAELVHLCDAYTNAAKHRELDLSGHAIQVIENLGTTRDGHDVLNLANNHIRVLGGFAALKRLDTLLLARNRIAQITPDFHAPLPSLRHLVLTENALKHLADLEPILTCHRLETLVLRGNPVTKLPHYKEVLVHRLPNLTMLDFERIGSNDKKAAKSFAKSKAGKQLLKDLAQQASTPIAAASAKRSREEEAIETEAEPIHVQSTEDRGESVAAKKQRIKEAIAKQQQEENM